MNRRKEITQILSKCFTESLLSAEESKILTDWRNQSDANEKLFEELTNAEEKMKHLKMFSDVDMESDWNKVKDKLKPKVYRFNLFRRLLPYAAALLIGLFLYLTNHYLRPTETDTIVHNRENIKNDVQAAVQGATLILADGRSITLDQHKNISNNQGMNLNTTGNELQITIDPNEISAPTALNQMVVPKGAYYTVVLADQTKVWVNANSKLTFPNAFSGTERRVKIEGEAYFDVSHDALHPFVVEANGTEVRVLGTKFNVNAYNDRVRTTLEQGKVELLSKGQKTLLNPGQHGEWNGEKFDINKANLAKELAWKNKEFRFENDDMIQIAYELSRWYDVQVKFAGDIDMKKQYSGSMSRDLSLAKVLNVLQFGSDFDFEIRDKELIIKNKKT